jgi:hypothetical protein
LTRLLEEPRKLLAPLAVARTLPRILERGACGLDLRGRGIDGFCFGETLFGLFEVALFDRTPGVLDETHELLTFAFDFRLPACFCNGSPQLAQRRCIGVDTRRTGQFAIGPLVVSARDCRACPAEVSRQRLAVFARPLLLEILPTPVSAGAERRCTGQCGHQPQHRHQRRAPMRASACLVARDGREGGA